MKKSYVIIGLIMFLVLGWIVGFSNLAGENVTEEIAYYEQLAKEQYELKAYGSVIKFYEKIISLQDTPSNRIYLADLYKKIENKGYYRRILEECITAFPKDSAAYEKLASYYYEGKKYEDCVAILKQGLQNGVDSERVKDMYYETAFLYNYVSEGYGNAYRFYDNTALVKKEDCYQYLHLDSSNKKSDIYEAATSMTENIAGVVKEKEAYYIDKGENKYLGTTEEYEKIWSMNEEKGVWKKGNQYGYINNFFAKTMEVYQSATSFKGGVAAVKQDNRWQLIDDKGNRIGKKTYQEVLLDEDNFCSNQGRIFVKDEKDYYMIDTSGKKIGKGFYEDAKPFYTEPITAVKIGGKWGFADSNGEVIIEPQYEDAQAFGYGVAAVKKDGLWGFITKNNRLVIDYVFEDAKNFSDNAIAPIKEGENWFYIKIYK